MRPPESGELHPAKTGVRSAGNGSRLQRSLDSLRDVYLGLRSALRPRL